MRLQRYTNIVSTVVAIFKLQGILLLIHSHFELIDIWAFGSIGFVVIAIILFWSHKSKLFKTFDVHFVNLLKRMYVPKEYLIVK